MVFSLKDISYRFRGQRKSFHFLSSTLRNSLKHSPFSIFVIPQSIGKKWRFLDRWRRAIVENEARGVGYQLRAFSWQSVSLNLCSSWFKLGFMHGYENGFASMIFDRFKWLLICF